MNNSELTMDERKGLVKKILQINLRYTQTFDENGKRNSNPRKTINIETILYDIIRNDPSFTKHLQIISTQITEVIIYSPLLLYIENKYGTLEIPSKDKYHHDYMVISFGLSSKYISNCVTYLKTYGRSMNYELSSFEKKNLHLERLIYCPILYENTIVNNYISKLHPSLGDTNEVSSIFYLTFLEQILALEDGKEDILKNIDECVLIEKQHKSLGNPNNYIIDIFKHLNGIPVPSDMVNEERFNNYFRSFGLIFSCESVKYCLNYIIERKSYF